MSGSQILVLLYWLIGLPGFIVIAVVVAWKLDERLNPRNKKTSPTTGDNKP